LKRLLGFAYITLKENARRRSFYGIVVAYLAALVFSRILLEFSLQDPTKVFLDFSFSFLSFFLVVSVLYITTDIMAKDIEKKSIYIILAKGISREDYIHSRAFGFLVFTFLFTLLLGVLFLFGVKSINYLTVTAYKKSIHLGAGFLTIFLLWTKVFLLSMVVMFFSTFMTNFFLVFLVSVVVFIAGSSVENLYYFVSVEKDRVSPLVKHVITGLFYMLPSFSTPGPDVILGESSLRFKTIALDLFKTVSYSVFLVVAGSLLFRRRELW